MSLSRELDAKMVPFFVSTVKEGSWRFDVVHLSGVTVCVSIDIMKLQS